jgi:hypothetical protein
MEGFTSGKALPDPARKPTAPGTVFPGGRKGGRKAIQPIRAWEKLRWWWSKDKKRMSTLDVSNWLRDSSTEPVPSNRGLLGIISTCPFGPLNCICIECPAILRQISVKLGKFRRLSRNLGGWSLSGWLGRTTSIRKFAPTGINRWSSKGIAEPPPVISILSRYASDTSRPS